MFFWFPTDPAETRIFNEEERKLSRDRFFADQPAIQEHKEAIETKLILRAFTAPVTLTCIWLYICNNITVQGLSIFTVTILRSVYPGRSTVQIQLLAVPPPVVGLVFALTMAYVAMKTGRHGYCIMFSVTLAIIGYALWVSVGRLHTLRTAEDTVLKAHPTVPQCTQGSLCRALPNSNGRLRLRPVSRF